MTTVTSASFDARTDRASLLQALRTVGTATCRTLPVPSRAGVLIETGGHGLHLSTTDHQWAARTHLPAQVRAPDGVMLVHREVTPLVTALGKGLSAHEAATLPVARRTTGPCEPGPADLAAALPSPAAAQGRPAQPSTSLRAHRRSDRPPTVASGGGDGADLARTPAPPRAHYDHGGGTPCRRHRNRPLPGSAGGDRHRV
ncbi:hypothetical protein [Actinopolyspora halophila]|uniref:hypothetical protein n=1 Tax=Actinopolyspora halophila TaxID=1850 RepID=UPI00035DDDAE|nr:hypothetical protein [Actinopolyspora halophila]